MEWNITRGANRCLECGKDFQEEEELFSSLYREQYNLSRKDFCATCWIKAALRDFFSFWKTRIPRKEEPKKRVMNAASLFNMFLRLGEETDQRSKNLRYVLALFLLRKKILRLKERGKDETGAFLTLYSPEEDKHFQVHDPCLTEEDINNLNDEILRLFTPPPEATIPAQKESNLIES